MQNMEFYVLTRNWKMPAYYENSFHSKDGRSAWLTRAGPKDVRLQ